MTTKETAAPEGVDFIPVKNITTADNVRGKVDKAALTELIESVKQNGILSPVLVRVSGINGKTKYELIAGHRRLAAAVETGLQQIPALVRSMTDEQADAARLVENLQRLDLEPMEEANAFQRLITRFGYRVDEVAARVMKPSTYIRTRLKLLDLIKDAQDAVIDHRLPVGHAFLIARLPAHFQAQAFRAICPKNQEVMGLGETHRYIRDNFMLVLSTAQFDIKDAILIPVAGSCLTCPKRTGHTKELFDDITKVDLCTDPACFKTKQRAHWDQIQEMAKTEKGLTILNEKDVKTLFPYANGDHLYSNRFVALDETCHDAKGDKDRSYRKLLAGVALPKFLVQRPDGRVVTLVEKNDAMKALRELKVPLWSDQNKSERNKKADATYREAQKIFAEAQRRVIVAIYRNGSRWADLHLNGNERDLGPLTFATAVNTAWHDSLKLVCQSLDIDLKKKIPSEALCKFAEDLKSAHGKFGLALALLAARDTDQRDAWLKFLGADSEAQIEKKVEAEFKAQKTKKVSGSKKAVKSAKKK